MGSLLTARLIMGVDIETLKPGDGANFPKPGSKVSCHYVLTLTNGTKVDSSRDRGQPFSFNLGRGEVIAGWKSKKKRKAEAVAEEEIHSEKKSKKKKKKLK